MLNSLLRLYLSLESMPDKSPKPTALQLRGLSASELRRHEAMETGGNMTHQANCLCGSVIVTAQLARHHFTACHCTMCRKWGGLWMAVECDSVSFEGKDAITTYNSSEMADRGFCSKCGTHLFFKSKWNGKYYLPVGLFDDIEDFVLKREIFYDTKPYYLCLANESEKYTEADLNRKHGIT